jgi:hypothetical protein
VAEAQLELDRRKTVLNQATERAKLLSSIVEMAHAESEVDVPGSLPIKVHVVGDNHLLLPKELRTMTLAFEKEFSKPLPISANGSMAVHRAMGFDHTGRVDVALAPDSAEGIWLIHYLDQHSTPYYAFRAAVAGAATAPHIHIGPGSTRLRSGD